MGAEKHPGEDNRNPERGRKRTPGIFLSQEKPSGEGDRRGSEFLRGMYF